MPKASHVWIGERDVNGCVSPFRGLPVLVVERSGMSQAGFDSVVRLLSSAEDLAARDERARVACAEAGCSWCARRSAWTAAEVADLFGARGMGRAGDGFYCEANFEDDLGLAPEAVAGDLSPAMRVKLRAAARDPVGRLPYEGGGTARVERALRERGLVKSLPCGWTVLTTEGCRVAGLLLAAEEKGGRR